MGGKTRRCVALGFGMGLALLTLPAKVAHADDDGHSSQPSQPSPEHLKAAAEEFDLGRRAYMSKDWDSAGVHFENAYRDAPRAETLRLAIRARRENKQLARAATLAAIAEGHYAGDAQAAELARETLAEAGPLLHEYTVVCASPCALAADGRVVSQADAGQHRIFLDPGVHELGVSFGHGRSTARRLEARAGQRDSLAFAVPQETAGGLGGTTERPAEHAVAPHRKPFGVAPFLISAGVTALVGAATVVSGIDTQNHPGPDRVRAECAGQGENCAAYQDGRSAQTRTNVLLGVTFGAALVTGVIGVFFTEWSSPSASRQGGRSGGLVGRLEPEKRSPNDGMRISAAPVPGGGLFGLSGQY